MKTNIVKFHSYKFLYGYAYTPLVNHLNMKSNIGNLLNRISDLHVFHFRK